MKIVGTTLAIGGTIAPLATGRLVCGLPAPKIMFSND